MTKKHSTKRALIASVLSLLLCVSMLIGTTFAWFTDSVTSANNIIKSGNLDVELEYAKVVDGNITGWATVKGADKIFDPAALWEPGRVEVVYLKVTNLGSLALKYQLGVNVVKEIPGINVAGEEFKLSNSLVFKAVEMPDALTTYSDREAVATAAGTEKGLKDYNGTTKALDPKDGANDEDYVALIVYMPETVGNEANYRGANVPTIELGVNLYATQMTAEEDSFNDQYDVGAWVDGFKVYNANELQAAIDAGETNITIENDIETSSPIVIPAAASTFSMRSAPVGVTINLNGKVVKGNYDKSVGAVIKNNGILTLVNGTVTSAANNGGSAVMNNGVLNLDKVTLNGAPNANGQWPSYTFNNVGTAIATNTKFTSYHGAVCSYTEGAVVTLNNCEIDMAGIPGFTSHGIYTYDGGSVIVNGGTYANNATDQNTTGASVINGAVTVNAGTFSGRIEAYYGTPVIKGGTFDNDPSKYMPEGYKATDNGNGTFTVKFPQESFDKLIDGAVENATVQIPAGTFTFPASDIKKGMTLKCEEGTEFTGTSSLNINGATVEGATFSNHSGTVGSGTINGTFKDCNFTGYNGLRWCYAGETVVFENCVFDGSVYGVHFDGGANEVLFKNCTISGFNTLGDAISMATFEGCTFVAGKSNYNGINLWGNTTMTDCTFTFDGKASTEWVDLVGSDKTASFNNCVVTDGVNKTPIEQVVRNFGTNSIIYIDGIPAVAENAVLKTAVAEGATKVFLMDGEYDLNGNQKDGLKLVGVGEEVKVANTTKYASGKSTGAIWQTITLENVTITNTVYTMADGGKSTFKNVNFAAGVRQAYGTGVTFEACTFGSNSEGYALHFQTDSASEGGLIKLNGCKFEGGKVHLGGKRAYEFTGCDFSEGTDFQVWSNITLENCTVNGEKVTVENMSTLFPNLNAEKVTLK